MVVGMSRPRRSVVDLDLTPSHGRLRAHFLGRVDDLRCRDIHRRRGACHAGADGGYPVFDARLLLSHLFAVTSLERGGLLMPQGAVATPWVVPTLDVGEER